MSSLKKHRKGRSGQRKSVVMIWTTVFGLVLIGMIGIAADVGIILSAGQQVQNMSDAASLAGARARQPSGSPWLWKNPFDSTALAAVRLAAKDEAYANFIYSDHGLLDDADIIVGQFDRNSQVFTASGYAGRPNAVQVTGRRTSGAPGGTVPLVFGPIFGYNTAGVQRDAIATMGAGMGAALIVLNRTENCAMNMNGGSVLTVQPVAPQTCADGAAIFVNSSHTSAACVPNNSTVHTTAMWIHGGFDGNLASVTEGICGSHDGNTIVREDTGICIPDPLGCTPCNSNPAGLCIPEPSTSDYGPDLSANYGNQPVKVSGGDIVVLDPGWYSKGISASGGSLTLKPGVYILGGATSPSGGATGLSVNGTAALCARGVLLFILGPHGQLDLEGTGVCVITPIGESPPFCDASYSLPASPVPHVGWLPVAVFQSRSNTNGAKIVGGSNMDLRGTFYFPSNHVHVSGSGLSLGTQVIVDTITVSGNSSLTINYDGRDPTVGSTRVFLVE